MTAEGESDHLNVGRVKMHLLLEVETKEEDLLLGSWQECHFLQQRNEIGRIDKHKIFEAGNA